MWIVNQWKNGRSSIGNFRNLPIKDIFARKAKPFSGTCWQFRTWPPDDLRFCQRFSVFNGTYIVSELQHLQHVTCLMLRPKQRRTRKFYHIIVLYIYIIIIYTTIENNIRCEIIDRSIAIGMKYGGVMYNVMLPAISYFYMNGNG